MRLCTFRDGRAHPPRSASRATSSSRSTGRDVRDALERPARGRPGRRCRLAGLELLAAAARRGRCSAIGLNYRDHAAETGGRPAGAAPALRQARRPSITGPGGEVVAAGLHRTSSTTRASWRWSSAGPPATCPPRRALDHVFGYAVMNDVTRARPPARRAPVDPRQGRRRLRPLRPVDHHRRRGARPSGASDPHLGQRRAAPGRHHRDMIFSVADLIACCSRSFTLRARRRDHHRHPGRGGRRPRPAGVPAPRRPGAGGDRRRSGALEHAIR